MKARFRKALTGVGVLAIAGGAFAATGGSALAATPAPYYPDAGAALGGLDFFNAAGQQITSGSTTDAPFANFVIVQDQVPGVTNPKATTFFYTPVAGVQPGSWSGAQVGNSSAYPDAAAPAPLNTLTNPDASGDTLSVSAYTATHPNNDTSTTDGYAGVYAIRVKITGVGSPATYGAADIQVTGTTWTQIDGSFKLLGDTTSTTLTATPPSPSTPGTNVTFTATVADTQTPATVPTGTVQFFNGSNQIGTTQTVDGTGKASVSTTALPLGSDSLTAVFTPNSATSFNGSTSAALQYTITAAPNDSSNTALSVNQSVNPPVAGSPVDLKAVVTDTTHTATVPTGTVNFFDNGATTAFASAPVTAGVAEIPAYTGFAQGDHIVTATFVPTAGSTINGSTSLPAPTFTDGAPACPNAEASTLCTDPQTVTATVAAGTITITTPYSPTNPLNLGTLALNAQGTLLSASAPFGNNASQGNEIFVTDTRAGDANWTASVQAGNFVSGSNSIDGQYSGLTGITKEPVAGNALTTSNVVTTDIQPGDNTNVVPNGSVGLGGPTKHTFANTTAGGDGSMGFIGTFTLNAPTSTPAGTYTGTVTFTVG